MNIYYSSGTYIANRYEVVQGPREKKSLIGGMGLVYLCNDHGDDERPVALKAFKNEYLPNRQARDRFLREGTTWVELGSHLHIVRAYRVERIGDGREVYIALEWVAEAEGKDNASLRAWLTPGKPLSLEQALLFALHIVRGMKHATTKIQGMVHRDLKPENVLVGRDGNARVTDFGLAQVLQDSGASTGRSQDEEQESQSPIRHTQLTKRGVGTPEYMAPEQWERRDIDQRADIYALGCILVETMTGKMPVQAYPRSLCRQLHQSGQALKAASGLPEVVEPVLTRCLAVREGERYASWSEVETALAKAYRSVAGKDAPCDVVAEVETKAARVAAGWSYNAMGLSYWDISKFDVAVGYFDRVVRIGKAEKERALEGAGLGNLGNAYRSLGDFSRSIEFHEQDLAIAREIGDRDGEGGALGNLGNAYHSLGDFSRSIEFHEQRLAIAKEIGYRAGEGKALGNLGNAYFSLSDFSRAIEFYEQSLAIVKEIGDRAGEGRALGNLGNAYRSLGDFRRAIEFYEQHLAIAREIWDRAGEGIILGNLGIAYCNLGDFRRAIEFHEQHLAIAKEIGDRNGEGRALGNLGIVYYNLGDFRRAIEFHEQHLAIAREIGDRAGEANALGNLGNAYYSLGDFRRAIEFYEQHLAIAKEIGDRAGEGRALGNLGAAYYDLGDFRRAIGFYEQHLAIAREIGDVMGAARTSFNLALLLSKHGQKAEALRHAEFAAQVFAKVGYPQYAQKVQQLISQLQRRRQ